MPCIVSPHILRFRLKVHVLVRLREEIGVCPGDWIEPPVTLIRYRFRMSLFGCLSEEYQYVKQVLKQLSFNRQSLLAAVGFDRSGASSSVGTKARTQTRQSYRR